jgi:ferrous iron transport protein B
MYPHIDRPLVALIGSPNAGKTSLFNALTGSHYDTVNYPGSTVECSLGELRGTTTPAMLIDSPGTYSLNPKSQDEKASVDFLFGRSQFPVPTLIVATVDATQLSRHLLLVRQLQETGFDVVVCLTMNDLLRKKGQRLDAERLSTILESPVVVVDARHKRGHQDLLKIIDRHLLNASVATSLLPIFDQKGLEEKMKEIARIEKEVIHGTSDSVFQRLDRTLMHPVWGLMAFAVFMGTLFTMIFWLADPLMTLVDSIFSAAASFILMKGGTALWADFLANGLILGLGSIAVFLPQIFILFVGLNFFESSGYLARAASLIDKPLSKIGLNGRSFVPLLSGFACAIPAMMAARTIPNRRERWLTLFIIPLMTCSARLPVHTLLLAFLFRGQAPWKPGLSLAAIYLLSLLLGAIAALLISRWLPGKKESLFMLELPAYRWPQWRLVLRTAYMKTQTFIRKAGPLILGFSLILWMASSFPHLDSVSPEEQMRQSYLAQVGHYLEPAFEPMGLDWRVGLGLLSAFAAREIFVSAMAISFNVSDLGDASMQDSILQSMVSARTLDGDPVFTTASVIGLIIFFMIALQCMSTVAIARKEFGNWRDPIVQLIAFNLIAYVLAVVVVQGLRTVGIA